MSGIPLITATQTELFKVRVKLIGGSKGAQIIPLNLRPLQQLMEAVAGWAKLFFVLSNNSRPVYHDFLAVIEKDQAALA